LGELSSLLRRYRRAEEVGTMTTMIMKAEAEVERTLLEETKLLENHLLVRV